MADDDFFPVKKAGALVALPHWLKERQYNFVKLGKMDKKNQPLIGLMFTEPGQQAQRRGLIVCADQTLYEETVRIVKQHKIRKEQSE